MLATIKLSYSKVEAMRRVSLHCALVFSLLVLTDSSAFAKPVSAQTAGEVATHWSKYQGLNRTQHVVLDVRPAPGVGSGVAWVVRFEGGGWAVAAGDDLLLPVYLYSEKGVLKDERPVLHVILKGMEQRLEALRSLNAAALSEITSERQQIWAAVLSRAVPEAAPVILGPLGTSDWGQGDPFNEQCHHNNACLVGCVATAMAQVMYYWRHPTTGQGSHSYDTATHGWPESANFGATTYDWGNMADQVLWNSPAVRRDAVAELSHHAGVSVEMDYCWDIGTGESLADTQDVPEALRSHFRYWDGVDLDTYTVGSIRYEVRHLRPLIARGRNPDDKGHAWMVDGYNASAIPQYHMRMGWVGDNDVWCTLDNVPEGLAYEHHVRYIAPDNVYFLSEGGSCYTGSPNCPFGNLATALGFMPDDRTLIIEAGTNWPGTYVLDKPMRIKGLNVTIGR